MGTDEKIKKETSVMKSFFWDITLCNVSENNQHFRRRWNSSLPVTNMIIADPATVIVSLHINMYNFAMRLEQRYSTTKN
jgi:hypothetical protein